MNPIGWWNLQEKSLLLLPCFSNLLDTLTLWRFGLPSHLTWFWLITFILTICLLITRWLRLFCNSIWWCRGRSCGCRGTDSHFASLTLWLCQLSLFFFKVLFPNSCFYLTKKIIIHSIKSDLENMWWKLLGTNLIWFCSIWNHALPGQQLTPYRYHPILKMQPPWTSPVPGEPGFGFWTYIMIIDVYIYIYRYRIWLCWWLHNADRWLMELPCISNLQHIFEQNTHVVEDIKRWIMITRGFACVYIYIWKIILRCGETKSKSMGFDTWLFSIATYHACLIDPLGLFIFPYQPNARLSY